MAEGDATVFNEFKEQLLLGAIDLVNDVINVALVTGYTLDIDGDAGWADVSVNEVSGTGYTAGGKALASKSVSQDNANDRAAFDAANVTWSSLNAGTPNYAIMYDGTHASDALIAAWELATASNGGDYTLQWHANGILLLS